MRSLRALRILLAFALLSAQQAALAHQIWHVDAEGKQPAQSRLCAYHEALGTVAGALNCPMLPVVGEAPAHIPCLFAALPAAFTPGLAPSSRGPPALL